ncbi:MAG: AI-2E family transporter [Acidobacteria bacterium]|nr:AI-2E family transporter [Acidobacteriota bacterium]
MEERRSRSRWVIAQKWLIWLSLIGVVFLLRHLFPIFFFTFILAYIGNTIVRVASRRYPQRRIILVVLYAGLIAAMSGVLVIVVPRLLYEARELARSYIEKDPAAVTSYEEMGGSRPVPQMSAPPPVDAAPVEGDLENAEGIEPSLISREVRRIFDSFVQRSLGSDTLASLKLNEFYEVIITQVEIWVAEFVPQVIIGIRELVNGFLRVALQFGLAILLSFLILWDLPRLRREIRRLATGRTSEVYEEIAPGMTAFGVMVGRAFEAQTVIALVNTLLTSLSFMALGLTSISLLSVIVFLCSYVPVFGVFLSTIPAALIALKVGGISKVLWLTVAILVVHAIEAYALNPVIYGHHMRMHPIAVLVILLVGEHLFGIWGLLLGVPIAAFVYRYVIRGDEVTLGPAESHARLEAAS